VDRDDTGSPGDESFVRRRIPRAQSELGQAREENEE